MPSVELGRFRSRVLRKAPQRIHVNCSIRVCSRRRVLMSLFSFQGAGAVQRQGRGYWQNRSAASSEKGAEALRSTAFSPIRSQRTDPAPAVRDSQHRPRSRGRQGYCTGTRAKNAQGLEASSGSGLDRSEGGVRASPLPRSNRARCAKGREALKNDSKLPKSEVFRGGAPNRRNPSHRISEAAQR